MPDATSTFLLSDLSGRLAFDLAAGLKNVTEVMECYGLTGLELKNLLENDAFAAMVREARARFLSDMSTPERVQVKAQLAVEDCIKPIYDIVHGGVYPAAAKIDATKLLASIAGLNSKPGGGDGAGGL